MNGTSTAGFPSTVAVANGSSFTFRKRWTPIDWRSLASVDVDKIAKEVDFQALQANIINITFCNINSEEFHNVDTNFIKLFRLAQLMIEYLLHSQQYLSDHCTWLEQELNAAQQHLMGTKEELSTKADEVKSLKRENRRRRKVIEAYQDMLNAGATGLHRCLVCSREFVTAEYLHSHMLRRHPDHLTPDQADSKTHTNVNEQHEELEKKLLDQMVEHLHIKEKEFREEIEKKERESLEVQSKELEEWKRSEQDKLKMEMVDFKEPILADLRNLQDEKAQLEKALQQNQAELEAIKAKKLSHLGQLEGAKEMDIDGSKHLHVDEKTRSDIEQLKEQLGTQAQEMQSALKKQEKMWKTRMQKLGANYLDQLKDSMGKLQSLEQSLHEQKDHDSQQALLSQQLASFHQKLKHHEERLHSQQQQLATLQSREPSPIPVGTTADAASYRIAADESLSESEESDATLESVDGDDVDAAPQFYSPLKHQPAIKTLYDHQPAILENIRQETVAILNDALIQRGFMKNASGVTSDILEEKMKILDQERQQRTHAHYDFTGHRERLSKRVEDMAAESFRFELEKEAVIKDKRYPKKTDFSSSLIVSGSKTASKPPKPTSTKQTTVQLIGSAANTSTVTQVPHLPLSSPPKEVIKVEAVNSFEVEEDFSEDSSEESEVMPESPKHSVDLSEVERSTTDAVNAVGRQQIGEDSPWDSEDDSIEELAMQFSNGRMSSTPAKKDNKVITGAKTKQVLDDEVNKQVSKTATSQSALTIVSTDEFEDSDLSDWT